MHTDIETWCRDHIGVPFVPDGRDRNGWDCWGLVMCAYKDVLGITLPEYVWGSPRKIIEQLADRHSPDWQSIPVPQSMAAACILRLGRPVHAGLYIGNRRIMHVEEGVATCFEPLSRFRIEGYYVPTHRITAPVQS